MATNTTAAQPHTHEARDRREALPFGHHEREPDDREAALVKEFSGRIKWAQKANEKRFEQYDLNRKYIAGEHKKDDSSGLTRTNLIFSTIATLLPQTYAKNPEIAVTPSQAVDHRQYKLYKQFARTLELVINRMFVRDARLKQRAKACARAAMTCEVGWAKVTFQDTIGEDPIIHARIADIQDNLQHIRALREKVGDPQTTTDADEAKLQAQLDSLEENLEVVVARGIVVDKLLSENVLVLDASVRDFDAYTEASAIAEKIWMDAATYERTFGYKAPEGAKTYVGIGNDKAPTARDAASASEGQTCFYCVYEIWDRSSQTVYTWCEGAKGWCRAPFKPRRLGERWYPYFGLGFNLVDGCFYPLSDVQLLIELQEEYNITRTNFAEHRKQSLPVWVVRSGGELTPDDVDKIRNRKLGEIVVVHGKAGGRIADDMGTLENTHIDPAVYDVAPIRSDIELVSGAGDAARGSVMRAKTATEAEIMQDGLMSRTSERQDTIEDWIGSMAQYSAECLLQELSVPEVQTIAGQGAVWPTLNLEQVFNLVQIEIRAGSTGKPNKTRERDQWVQLAPILSDTMVQIADFRAKGAVDIADGLIEIVREMMRRFDERLDLDSFIPPKSMEEGGQDPTQQMLAQIPALQQQNEELTATTQQLQQQLEQATQQLQGKDAEIEAANARHESEQAAKVTIAREQMDRQDMQHRDKLAMQQQAAAMQGVTPEVLQALAQQVAQLQQVVAQLVGAQQPSLP